MLPPEEADDDTIDMYELFGFRRPALDVRRERCGAGLVAAEFEVLRRRDRR